MLLSDILYSLLVDNSTDSVVYKKFKFKVRECSRS